MESAPKNSKVTASMNEVQLQTSVTSAHHSAVQQAKKPLSQLLKRRKHRMPPAGW